MKARRCQTTTQHQPHQLVALLLVVLHQVATIDLRPVVPHQVATKLPRPEDLLQVVPPRLPQGLAQAVVQVHLNPAMAKTAVYLKLEVHPLLVEVRLLERPPALQPRNPAPELVLHPIPSQPRWVRIAKALNVDLYKLERHRRVATLLEARHRWAHHHHRRWARLLVFIHRLCSLRPFWRLSSLLSHFHYDLLISTQ